MQLLTRIEQHMRTTGITPTRLGREAANDSRLVHDIRRGREIGRKLATRVLAWLEQQA
ncbi:MAG: hypothetical protein ACKVOP_11805 [Sphingomonadaceae bacterium]